MPIHEYCAKRKEENWLLKPTITLDNIITTYRQIRDLKTVRRGRLRGHDNQRHFGGKTWKPSSSSLRVLARMSYWWKQVVTNNVRSFINLQSGEDLIFFNKKHCVNFSGKKKIKMKLPGFFCLFLRICVQSCSRSRPLTVSISLSQNAVYASVINIKLHKTPT